MGRSHKLSDRDFKLVKFIFSGKKATHANTAKLFGVSRSVITTELKQSRPPSLRAVQPPDPPIDMTVPAKLDRARFKAECVRLCSVVETGVSSNGSLYSNRPFSTSPAIKRKLEKENSPYAHYSERSIRKALEEEGCRWVVRPLQQSLKEGDRDERMKFAELVQASIHNIAVVSADEHWTKKVQNCHRMERVPPDQQPTKRSRASANAIRNHIFVAIGYDFARLIHLPTHRLTAAEYIEFCLKPIVKELKEKILVLLHDKAGYHTAKIVEEFLENAGVRWLVLPSRSPDGNYVEQSWEIIENMALGMGWEVDMKNVARSQALLTKAFKAVPLSVWQNLALSFQARWAKIEAAGGEAVSVRTGLTAQRQREERQRRAKRRRKE
jgi:hypothetical protein